MGTRIASVFEFKISDLYYKMEKGSLYAASG